MNAAEQRADTIRPECLPACECAVPTRWDGRRYLGELADDVGGVVLESRRCLECGTSSTREVR